MKRGRGHSAGLTREMVLDAAMALIDREGLSALSMRRLGSELGVEAMTVYHHVPSKNALLDGLVERSLTLASEPLSTGSSWQDALRGLARSWLAMLRAHPDLVPLLLSRPAITTGNPEVMEAVLRRLHHAGFPLGRGLDILYAIAGLVVGQAATAPGEPGARTQVAALEGADLHAYPLLAEAARSNRAEQTDRFDFALEALLDGFQAERSRHDQP